MATSRDTRILNLKPSPFDQRDWKYSRLINEKKMLKLPLVYKDVYNHFIDNLPVRDQGNTGTCAAHVISASMECRPENRLHYMSPQFIYDHRSYWNNNVQDGDDPKEDNGMFARNAMNIVVTHGIPKESEYSYGGNKKIEDIPQNIKDSALTNKPHGYYRVYTFNELRYALFNHGPVFIAFYVYNMEHPNGYIWMKGSENEEPLGGHAMTVVGYDESGFIIRNTWGDTWNGDGYCKYPYAQWGEHIEMWCIIHDKENYDNHKEVENNKDKKVGCCSF